MKNGELLERKVYKTLKNILLEGKLGLNPEQCRLFRQKAYYSRTRDNYIKVDVSIELFLRDNPIDPVIIWVWECKDYSSSIPVGEIEKFNAVLEQIGAAKTKGTVISSEGVFDRSAIKYATAQGIGLAKLMPDDNDIDFKANNFIPYDPIMMLCVVITGLIYPIADCILSRFSQKWRQRSLQSLEREFYGITSHKAGVSSFDKFVQRELRNLSGPAQSRQHKTRSELVPEGFSRARDLNIITCRICRNVSAAQEFDIDLITNCVCCPKCGSAAPSHIPESSVGS